MRRFIVVGHDAVTSGDFGLKDLAGATGRLDILLRCINSVFMLSHSLRTDAELYLVLLGPPTPPRILRMVGSELRHLNPDERSTASLVRRALSLPSEGSSTPGIYLQHRGLEELLREFGEALVYLREDGDDLRSVDIPHGATFVLSDHKALTREEEQMVMELRPRVVSVGPMPLHADHCIVVVHNELDLRGL